MHHEQEMDMSGFGAAEEEIPRIAEEMACLDTKGGLGSFLADLVARYSMFDLQVISGRTRHDIDLLPMPYREVFRPYAEEWFWGRYHRLLRMARDGSFAAAPMRQAITDPETFQAYCAMLPEGCLRGGDEVEFSWGRQTAMSPWYQLFYYLLCAYAMYVLDEPGHPVGTPFPGGLAVHFRDGDYYCAIRDKEEEILHSICNFCPALQDPANL